jgi:hypothetical protein
MISISHIIKGLASHDLVLSLIIVMTTTTLGSTTITISSSPPLVQNAFADPGQEIVIKPKDMSLAPVSFGEGGNQVKVVVDYAVHDPMVANDLAKAVMKVYSPNGTLLKTSSSPTPFPISDSYGTTTLATTLKDPTVEGVVARIAFTNPIKAETISNELPVSVDLVKGAAALSGELQDKTKTPAALQSESEPEQEAQVRLPSEDKPSSTEPSIGSLPTEEEQQLAELKETPVVQGKQQVTSIESKPQTMTDNPSAPPAMTTITPPTTTTASATYIAEEICGDGIDNDSDALVDFSDEQCNPLQSKQQPPKRHQGQTMAISPEICDDDLDNDFDGKVDSRDKECSYITSTSSFPSSGQGQSVTDGQTEAEEEDIEQQSNEDLSKESSENKDGDGEDNKEDDGNDDENEDEDKGQQSDDNHDIEDKEDES